MKTCTPFLLAICLAASCTTIVRADGIDEVANFVFRWDLFRVAQGDRGETLPATIFPSPPAGFNVPGDVDFVAKMSNLSLVSWTFVGAEGAFVTLRNGNFGLVVDVRVRNPGTEPLDFADLVFLFDIINKTGGSARYLPQMAPTTDPEGDFDIDQIINGGGTFDGFTARMGFVIEDVLYPGSDSFADEPLRAYNLSSVGILNPGAEVDIALSFDTGVPFPTDDCNGNWIFDSGETDSDGDGVIDDCDNCPAIANADQADCDGNGIGDTCDSIVDQDGDGFPDACDACPAENPGELDLNGDGCTDTTVEVAQVMEETVTPLFEQTIDQILTDPNIPDEIADDIQAALNDVIGNAGGNANNGAVDKLLQTGNVVAAIVKTEAAIADLQAAAAQGFDTTDLQQLVTDFTRLGVLAAIVEAESVLGSGDPAIVAAQSFFAAGDLLLTLGDFLGALDLYKTAAQEIT